MFKCLGKIAFRAIGRQALSDAVCWSFVVHCSAFAVAYAWPFAPTRAVSLSGHRNVIQLEAVAMRTSAGQNVAGPVQADASQSMVEPFETDPVRTDQPDLTPAVAPPMKQSPSPAYFSPRTIAPESTGDAIDPARQTRSIAKAELFMQTPPKTTESPGRAPTRRVYSPPQVLAAVRQRAGVDDKVSPDFSGNRPPDYPSQAVRARWEGTVLLRLHVSNLGVVERAEIVRSSGHRMLDQAAVNAVLTWKGQPARRNGLSRASVELLPIRFRL